MIALALVLACATARAQAPDDEEARVLFERGREAAEQGRVAEAAELFRASLELRRHAAPAINLAVVLRAMGRPLAAREVLRELVAGSYGELAPEYAGRVRELDAEARSEVASISVAIAGTERASVWIDGESVARRGSAYRLEVEPGEHVVLARSAAGQTIERAVRIAPGGEERVELAFEPVARADDDDDDATLWESPWTYILSLAVAGAIAGGVVAVVFYTSDDAIEDEYWGAAVGLALD